MKRLLTFLITVAITGYCYSQNGFTMEPGQKMSIDGKGNVVTNASLSDPALNGKSSAQDNSIIVSDPRYNEDGTIKIPGYKPTGDPEADKELYKKAKFLLYQNNLEEYNRIFSTPEKKTSVKRIPYEEFKDYPDNKKQIILSHPEKYLVVMPVDNSDCK